MNTKRTFSILLATILVLSMMATGVLASDFTDVEKDAYYSDAVYWAVENGITNGIGNNKFAPDDTCTRAQIVTFLWRAENQPEPTNTTNPFVDVKSSDYFYKAVLWAVENGITTGTGDTTFSPDDNCTRAQAVTFLWRSNGSKDSGNIANQFVDVDMNSYYAKAVSWAVDNEITTGTSNDTFSPDNPCSRAQIVTFLFRTEKSDPCKYGHTEVIDKAIAPTCTKTGLTEGSHCSVCGITIKAQEVISVLGHTEVIDEAVEPTVTSTGLTEGSHCSACGIIIVAQQLIPKLSSAEASNIECYIVDSYKTWKSGTNFKEYIEYAIEIVAIEKENTTGDNFKTTITANIFVLYKTDNAPDNIKGEWSFRKGNNMAGGGMYSVSNVEEGEVRQITFTNYNMSAGDYLVTFSSYND